MAKYEKPSGKFQSVKEIDPTRVNVSTLRTECAKLEKAVEANDKYVNEYARYVESNVHIDPTDITAAILEDLLWEAQRTGVLDSTLKKELTDFGQFELVKTLKNISRK